MIDRFKILPTDPRFKELTVDVMEALFISAMEIPSDEEYRDLYRKAKFEEEMELPEDELKKLGYSEEDMIEIKEAVLRSRGM